MQVQEHHNETTENVTQSQKIMSCNQIFINREFAMDYYQVTS